MQSRIKMDRACGRGLVGPQICSSALNPARSLVAFVLPRVITAKCRAACVTLQLPLRSDLRTASPPEHLTLLQRRPQE